MEFVAAGIEASLATRLVGEIYLGDEEFIRERMPGAPVAEVPRRQWQPLRPSLDALLCREGAGLLAAYRTYGYRLREIGAYLGVHPATVSRALVRLEQAADAGGETLSAETNHHAPLAAAPAETVEHTVRMCHRGA